MTLGVFQWSNMIGRQVLRVNKSRTGFRAFRDSRENLRLAEVNHDEHMAAPIVGSPSKSRSLTYMIVFVFFNFCKC